MSAGFRITGRKQWTPAQDARLCELFTAGELGLGDIAQALGFGKHAVRNRLGRLRELGQVGYRRPPVRGAPKVPGYTRKPEGT